MGDGRPEYRCQHKGHDLSTLCLSCWNEMKAENAELRRELHQWQMRVSPATEPCACPEFCTYHARSRFDALRLEVKRLVQYADHKRDCALWDDPETNPCSCGFQSRRGRCLHCDTELVGSRDQMGCDTCG